MEALGHGCDAYTVYSAFCLMTTLKQAHGSRTPTVDGRNRFGGPTAALWRQPSSVPLLANSRLQVTRVQGVRTGWVQQPDVQAATAPHLMLITVSSSRREQVMSACRSFHAG